MEVELTAAMIEAAMRKAAELWYHWADIAEANSQQHGLEHETQFNRGLVEAYRECAENVILYLDNL